MSYFTTDELRAIKPFDDEARFTDDDCTRAHDFVAALIERVCRTSFVGVSTTETLDGNGSDTITLRAPYVVSVDSVTVDGVAYDAGELAALSFKRGGILRQPIGGAWPCGRANVDVTYTAGYSSTPPGDLKDVAIQAARYRLLTTDEKSVKSSRATSRTSEFGTESFSVASPDRPTGLPEVDAVLLGWAAKVAVFGFGA